MTEMKDYGNPQDPGYLNGQNLEAGEKIIRFFEATFDAAFST